MCKRMIPALVALAAILTVGPINAAAEYPEGAKGFAGMVAGKITAKGENQITVEVTKIEKTWKASTAKNPEALVGKSVVIKFDYSTYNKKPVRAEEARKLFSILKVGDSDSFDCKNTGGDSLTFLELTAAQKKRAGISEK